MIDIYLAIPYSDPDPLIREMRFRMANARAAELMDQGVVVFSPISHSHTMAVAHGLPLSFSYWAPSARVFLEVSREIEVIRADGWEKSVGVQGEMAIMRNLERPIRFFDPSELEGFEWVRSEA